MPPLDDNGQGTETEAGTGAGGTDAGDKGGAPDWAQTLNGSVSELTNTMKQLMQAASVRQQEVNQQQQRGQTATPPDDDDDDADPISAEQLELMSRAEFGSHLMKQLIKAVNNTVVGPINQRITELSTATTRQDIQGAVKELASANKDFYDWKDEMIALATEHKGLPPARLYALARAENAAKAQKLDAKYNPKKPEGKIRFGGFTPNASGTGSKGQKMGAKQASDVAWAETVAALGGTPIFDDEE